MLSASDSHSASVPSFANMNSNVAMVSQPARARNRENGAESCLREGPRTCHHVVELGGDCEMVLPPMAASPMFKR